MSALAERPATASVSMWLNATIEGESLGEDPLIEDAPIEFGVLSAALTAVSEGPEEEYPEGSGPYGF